MNPYRTIPLACLALLACNKDGSSDDGDDTDLDFPGGCVTINGYGGWPTAQAAIDAAAEGDTIDLCEVHEEAIVVTKSLTLKGVGIDATTLDPPLNEPAIAVSEGVVLRVEALTISSTRSGITGAGATIDVADVLFTDVDNYGIDVTDGTVSVTDVTFEAPAQGGIKAVRSDVTVTTSTFVDPVEFGISVDGGSAVVTGSTITGVLPPEGAATVQEGGWAIMAKGAIVTSSGNTYGTNQFGDIIATGASTLTMEGDASDGSQIGVWTESSGVTLTDVTIENYVQYGIVYDGGTGLSLTDTVIATTAEGSNPQASHDDLSGSYGVVAFGADVTMTGGSISGNNGGGLYQGNGNTTSVNLTMTDVVVDDNARYGIVSFLGQMTFTNVTVTNTRDDDATCYDESGYIVCNMALSAWQSDLDMTGGLIEGNGSYGLSPLFGTTNLTDVTFRDNAGSAIFGYESAVTCDGCAFEQTREYGFYLQTGTGVLKNSTFDGGNYVSVYEYTDSTTGEPILNKTYYQAQDAWIYESDFTIENTAFTNGESGVLFYGSTATVTDTTFDAYNTEPFYTYDSTVDLVRTTFTNIGSNPIYCYDANLNLDQVRIENVTAYKYKYESFVNGELSYEYETLSPGTAIYANTCVVTIEDTIIEEVQSRGIYLYNSSGEIDGLAIRGTSTAGYSTDAALYAYFQSSTPDLWVNDVEITGVVNGYGVYVGGSTTYPGGYVEMTGLKLGLPDAESRSGINSQALYAHTLDSFTLSGFDIADSGSDAIGISAVKGTITGVSGIYGGTITSPLQNGINATNADLTIGQVTITGAGASGLLLTGGTYDVDANTVTGATEYGMECVTDPALTCGTNTFEGTLGDVSACSCGGSAL